MASKRISELPLKSTPDNGDLVPIVDTQNGVNNYVSKKTTVGGILSSVVDVADARIDEWWSSSADKAKLDGIAAGATANATNAQLRDRATHTGTQTASTISDFTAAVIAAAPPTTNASLLTSGTLAEARLPASVVLTTDARLSDARTPLTHVHVIGDVTGLQSALDAKATPADVTSAVAAVVNAAPASLDTLKELADALGNDASFATTVTNSIAAKAPINNPTFTGTVGGITKSMVGLGSVDNTSDADKPISSAVQTALNAKAETSHAHGSITSDGKIGTTSGQIVVTGSGGALTTTATISASSVSGLSAVATSGSYTDLSNTPASYSLPTASNSTLGGVKIGTGISIDGNGVISAAQMYTLPNATTSTLGGVIVGSGLSVSSGTVSADVTSVAGRTGAVTLSASDVSGLATVATSGSYNDLSNTPAAYSLPTAGNSTLGGVKIGSGVSIDGSGVISVSTNYAAPSHTHGNITNDGKIGSTSGQIVVTTTDGVLTTAATVSIAQGGTGAASAGDARTNLGASATNTPVYDLGAISGTTALNFATDRLIQTLSLAGTATTFTKGTGWPTDSTSVDIVLRITVTVATTITWSIVTDWFNQPAAGQLTTGTHLFLLRAVGASIIEGHYVGRKTN